MKNTRFLTLVCLLACAMSFAKPILELDFSKMPAELQGSARLAPGYSDKGKGLWLDGHGRLEYQPSQELLAAEEACTFTFECWMLREDEDEEGFLIRHNGAFAVRILPWDKRRIGIGVWTRDAGYVALDSEPCLPAAGTWQHVGVVFKPQEVELYINGNRQFTKALVSPMRVSKHTVVIGAGLDENKQTPISPFVGTLSELKISAEPKGKEYFGTIAEATTENFDAVHSSFGIPPKCAPGKAIDTQVPPTLTTKENGLVIANSFYTLELQTKPELRVKRLFSNFTDCECLQSAGSPLFAVALDGNTRRAPTESFAVTDVTVEQEAKVIHVQVTAKHATGVEMRISLDFDDTEEIAVGALLRNGGQRQRIVPCVPLLENLAIGPDFNENWYFNPQVSGWAGKASYEIALAYGFRSWIQLADVFSPTLGGGVALTGQDTKGVVKGIATRKTKKSGKVAVNYNLCWVTAGDKEPMRMFDDKGVGLGLGFIYYPLAYEPGEAVTLPPAKISVHRGDILNPLMRYADWSKQAFPHDPIPKNALAEFNMVAVHPRGGNSGYKQGFDTPEGFKLADRIAPDGSDHLLQPAFWWWRHEQVPLPNGQEGETMYKYTSGEGDYEYDPRLGGKEALAAEIRACNAQGTDVVLYTCSRVAGDDSSIVREHKDWERHKAPGVSDRSWGTFNVCTSVPAWQDMYTEANARLLRDLPVSGVYLDTTAEILTCHNPAHAHPRFPQDAIFSLLKKMRDTLKPINPDAYIMTEYIGSEAFGMYIDACWIQTFAHPYAHHFNNYDLDFARFVYPKVKYHEWGMTPKTFEVDSRRAFFNGVGAARGDLEPEQKNRYADMSNTQREMYDALASENPVPFVPTLTEYVYANYFPGHDQTAWTYYNKAGKQVNAPVLKVQSKPGINVHYVELLKDREITPKDGVLALDMEDYEVGMIAAFPRILQAVRNGDNLEIDTRCNPSFGQIVCVPAGKRDSRENYLRPNLSHGKASVPLASLGQGQAIVKFYHGHLLLEEILVTVGD